MAIMEITLPTSVHMRSGTSEKAVRPVIAKPNKREKLKLLCPARRAWVWVAMPSWVKPTQLYRPFIKRLRSGIWRSASMMQRSSTRKSWLFSGIRLREPAFSSK